MSIRLFVILLLLLGVFSYKNDYILKDFSYTDEKKNHLTGTIEYTGTFNPKRLHWNDIYGFGERYHKLKLGEGIFTLWPNDTSGIHEDKGDGCYNAMGTHPMALHKTSAGKFLGLIFNNINA